MRRRWIVVAVLVAVRPVTAAEPPPGLPPAPDDRPLAAREAELLQRYRDLEAAFLRLADALDATDPARATALRAAFERGREVRVGDRVAAIVEQLERGQLLQAGTGQLDAIEQFRALLELLEAGGAADRLGDTRRMLRELVGRVARLVARQRDVEGATEAGDDADALADRQGRLAAEARRLVDDVGSLLPDARPASDDAPDAGSGRADDDEGPDAEGPDDGGSDDGGSDDAAARARRTAERVRAAEQRMEAARRKLEDAMRDDARREQARAVEALETARAELEEILRQVREEEVERTLVQLEARIRGMLKAERGVLADTERLAAGGPGSPRERQLEAARLGRVQDRVGADATKALALVRDDGSAVAIPQALEQVRDDATQAAARLGRADVGRETLDLQREIVGGLEEMLAAVEKAHVDRAAGRTGPAGGQGTAAGEQPLVDALAELKMLRTLQVRVNTRTQRLARLLDDAPPAAAEVRQVLRRLAERQRAIERAARDIVTGVGD